MTGTILNHGPGRWLRGRPGWLAVLAWVSPVVADEGMWLFNKPPVAAVREACGFELTPEWLEHLRLAAVRIGSGGSGSFVSAHGLVLTNHHVGAGTIERLGSRRRDLLRDGFLAPDFAGELRCPGLELSVLVAIEDVTAQVHDAVPAGGDPAAAVAARREVIARIERDESAARGLKCEVVPLHRGALHHLYQFRRWDDVRLVFAPDARAATFGGDPDNFEFPRHCLDFCLFRAYQDGKPADAPRFLRWHAAGAEEGEPVFVAGHPGNTNRAVTQAQLEALRDDTLPHQLERCLRTEALLRAWADRDPENARRARQSIVGTQNARKAVQARLDGLLDPALMARRAAAEQRLREALRADPQWREADAAFERIAAAEARGRAAAARTRMLEGGEGFGGKLFGIARTLVRVADESAKPDGERLPEFRDSRRATLEHGLFAATPVHRDLEEVLMAGSLGALCARLGATDATVARVLAGKSPRARAAELIGGTALDRVPARRRLYQGGRTAVEASQDPLVLLARTIDPEARALRAQSDELAEQISQAHRVIADARFALEGDACYPDANSTLRLSFGAVRGYADPHEVPAFTTFGSMLERHRRQRGAAPFELSERWLERAAAIDPATRLNFVTTHDITGGNSGSPMVNRRGELVGLVFDGNAPALLADFVYDGARGRAISVHPAAMLAALGTIYQAGRVVAELTE